METTRNLPPEMRSVVGYPIYGIRSVNALQANKTVRQREIFLEISSRRRSECQCTAKKNATKTTIAQTDIGLEKFSCPKFSCPNSEVGQEDCGQEDFRSRRSRGFHLGGERKFSQTAEPVTTANAWIGPAILDGASPPHRAVSFEKSVCALVRARLTSVVGRKKAWPS
jgi:hypothetical protein